MNACQLFILQMPYNKMHLWVFTLPKIVRVLFFFWTARDNFTDLKEIRILTVSSFQWLSILAFCCLIPVRICSAPLLIPPRSWIKVEELLIYSRNLRLFCCSVMTIFFLHLSQCTIFYITKMYTRRLPWCYYFLVWHSDSFATTSFSSPSIFCHELRE